MTSGRKLVACRGVGVVGQLGICHTWVVRPEGKSVGHLVPHHVPSPPLANLPHGSDTSFLSAGSAQGRQPY